MGLGRKSGKGWRHTKAPSQPKNHDTIIPLCFANVKDKGDKLLFVLCFMLCKVSITHLFDAVLSGPHAYVF